MLGPPVHPPLLATNSVAVRMRAVREISRKGSNDARSQVGADANRLLLGWFRGWRGQLQRLLQTASRLSSTVEGFSLLQHLPKRRGDSREIQETSRLRNDAAETRRSLVLRSE